MYVCLSHQHVSISLSFSSGWYVSCCGYVNLWKACPGWVLFRAPFLIGYLQPPLMKTLSANIRGPPLMPLAHTHTHIHTSGPLLPTTPRAPYTHHALLSSQNVWAEKFIGTKLHPSNLLLTLLPVSRRGFDSLILPLSFQTAHLSHSSELIGKQIFYICGKQMCSFFSLFLSLMGKGWECDWWMYVYVCLCKICECSTLRMAYMTPLPSG